MGRRGGGREWRCGEREIIYLSLHCHCRNDCCIKIGSDESHVNVSVGSEGQSHKTVSTNHNLSEEKAEPNRGPCAYQPNAIPLGQTGSLIFVSRSLSIYTFHIFRSALKLFESPKAPYD